MKHATCNTVENPFRPQELQLSLSITCTCILHANSSIPERTHSPSPLLSINPTNFFFFTLFHLKPVKMGFMKS